MKRKNKGTAERMGEPANQKMQTAGFANLYHFANGMLQMTGESLHPNIVVCCIGIKPVKQGKETVLAAKIDMVGSKLGEFSWVRWGDLKEVDDLEMVVN